MFLETSLIIGRNLWRSLFIKSTGWIPVTLPTRDSSTVVCEIFKNIDLRRIRNFTKFAETSAGFSL